MMCFKYFMGMAKKCEKLILFLEQLFSVRDPRYLAGLLHVLPWRWLPRSLVCVQLLKWRSLRRPR